MDLSKLKPSEGRCVILVVDDHEANLLAMQATLSADYELITARTGPEAIAIMETRPDVDVILMDVQMPGMDGFEAATRIRKIPDRQDVPIVFVSAVFVEDPSIKRGYQVGGIDYFTKPFDPDVLKLKVAVYAAFRRRAAFLRERELHLRESEELGRTGRTLANLLESLPVGVLIADADGRIFQITETASRMLGIAPADYDVIARLLDWWDESGQKLKDENGPLALALRSGNTSPQARLKLSTVDGRQKTLVIGASPLFAGSGNVVGAVVLLQDVTATEEIGVAIEQRVAKLLSLGMELQSNASS